ncbi:hypothetical protein HMPREF9999_00462 [Alloprevotella sp. oral taxon 473 str. F0040]|nr:hypothetical protein HMPREF9999_00462 [Alloprevotella sp. oral taxon 473 str. F0040]
MCDGGAIFGDEACSRFYFGAWEGGAVIVVKSPSFAKLTTQKEGWMKKKVQIFPIFSLFGVISTHI